jgi:hypothetical protein
MRRRAFIAAFAGAMLFCTSLYGGSIVQVSAFAFWFPFSGQAPPCNQSVSATGTTAAFVSASCPQSQMLDANASASVAFASGVLQRLLVAVAAEDLHPTSFDEGSQSRATASDEELLTAVGGSGPATLLLQFQLRGGENAFTGSFMGTSMNFTLKVNGAQALSMSCPPGISNGFLCASNPPFVNNVPVSLNIPVTFNTGVDFTEQLGVSATPSLGGFVSPVNFGPDSGVEARLTGYSILDQNGQPIPGSSLISTVATPEPAGLPLVFLSLIAMAAFLTKKAAR